MELYEKYYMKNEENILLIVNFCGKFCDNLRIILVWIKQHPIEFVKFCPNILALEHSGKDRHLYIWIVRFFLNWCMQTSICAYILHLSHMLEGHGFVLTQGCLLWRWTRGICLCVSLVVWGHSNDLRYGWVPGSQSSFTETCISRMLVCFREL
jgi:hypothetical protein